MMKDEHIIDILEQAPLAALSESGALPAGVAFTDNGDGTATLSGTPNTGTGASHTLTLTGSNGIGSDATQTFTLLVDEPSGFGGIVSGSTTFKVGAAGSFTIGTTGFPAPSLIVLGA